MANDNKHPKPNYYSVLTPNIRYATDISGNEKVLYTEIIALCNIKGHCWASNRYFAKAYGVAPNTISGWIKNLENKGYITTEITYKDDTKEIDKRIIKPTHLQREQNAYDAVLSESDKDYLRRAKALHYSLSDIKVTTLKDVLEYQN